MIEKNFKIENFEGPLDLLLHLIKKQKLNILEISLSQVCDQYIEYINNVDFLNFDIAAEYFLIAATLIEIKSKRLLKSDIFVQRTKDNGDDADDLLERLIEYEWMKKYSIALNDILLNNQKIEKADNELIDFFGDENNKVYELKTNGLKDILLSIDNITKRLEKNQHLEQVFRIKRMSMEERKKEIEIALEKSNETTFYELIDSIDRYYIAISLLVLLEMSSKGLINMFQIDNFNDIKIIRLYDGF